MYRLALIENGIVSNVIKSPTLDHHGAMDVTDQPAIGPGWSYDGTAFSAPAPPDPGDEGSSYRMTSVELLSRFTVAEKAAIFAAQSTDPVVGAFLLTLQVAQEVDSDNLDLIESLDYLENAGHIAAGRAVAILSP